MSDSLNEIVASLHRICAQPYKLKPIYLVHNNITIQRPNHGTAHGARQALLALDIVEAIQNNKSSNEALTAFIRTKSDEKYFIVRMQMAAAFQRAGRESEASGRDEPELFRAFLERSGEIFLQAAQVHPLPGLLGCPQYEELEKYATAMHSEVAEDNCEAFFLKIILDSAHYLDLLRLCSEERCRPIINLLKIDLETYNKLVCRAKSYLSATGELKNHHDADRIVRLYLSQHDLVRTLLECRSTCR